MDGTHLAAKLSASMPDAGFSSALAHYGNNQTDARFVRFRDNGIAFGVNR